MSSFSKILLGKHLQELTYQDVEDFFISEHLESDKLEFKAFGEKDNRSIDKKFEGIVKTVTAFLNSDGGICIWGAPEKQKINGREVFIGQLSPIPSYLEKDMIVSKLSDKISPLPRGVLVQVCEKDGKFLYVIEVEKSPYSPHQIVGSGTYYMRIDAQTKPAPHHYVEALFKRVNYPELQGFCQLISRGRTGPRIVTDLKLMVFNLSQTINEKNLQVSCLVRPGHYPDSALPGGLDKDYLNNHTLHLDNAASVLSSGMPCTITETVYWELQQLEKHNFEAEVSLYFGGEKSPRLNSKYKFKFTEQTGAIEVIHASLNKPASVYYSDTKEIIKKFGIDIVNDYEKEGS